MGNTVSLNAEQQRASQGPAVLGLVALAGLLFQLLSRYAAAPVADHTSDTWYFIALGRDYPGWGDWLGLMLAETDRPVMAPILAATFGLIGDAPVGYALLGMGMYSLHLLLGMDLARRLSGSLTAALVYAVVFSLWPNLFESFGWAAMTGTAYVQVAYLVAAYGWVRYLEGRLKGWLFLSVLGYAVALGSYEFGIALPAALAVLLLGSNHRTAWKALLPYAGVLVVYLSWRFTRGFGLAPTGVLFTPREVDLSAATLFWNLRELVMWWGGEHLVAAIAQGWAGFSRLSAGAQAGWGLVNLLAVIGLGWLLGRTRATDAGTARPYPLALLLAFGAVWALGGLGISVISWTAARLNFYPAVGLTLMIAGGLAACPRPGWTPALLAATLLLLPVNQGTAVQWREAGAFHRRLFMDLAQTRDQWRDRAVLLIDTTALRHRQTAGLDPAFDNAPRTWAYHGNASLLRGFVPVHMVNLLVPDGPRPEVVLDLEHGARREGDALVWHGRLNPADPRRTPWADVLVLPALPPPETAP
jgi:hypothetical protein